MSTTSGKIYLGDKLIVERPSYTLDEVSDGSTRSLANYLPLSGGTLSSYAIYPLILNSTNTNNAAGIRFSVSNTNCGGIYVTNNHELRFYDESSAYRIYHSGNFVAGTDYVAPSALSNYLTTSGGKISDSLQIFSPNTNPFGVYGGSSGAYLAFGKTTTTGSAGTRYGMISINAQDGDLKRYKGNYGGGYKIYDEGNYSGGGGSDARLKENVETISSDDAKDTLSRLRPVRFDWNEKAKELDPRKRERIHDVGFIAQEAKEIVPTSVTQDYWDKYYRMDNAKLVAFLVKGWQEHEKEIVELKEEIKRLKSK